MKYLKLPKIDLDKRWNNLALIEDKGETYFYDGEAVREVIIVHRDHVQGIFGVKIDDDFLDETSRVFLVVIEATAYVIALRDVSKHLDALVTQLEIAQMAEKEKI